MRMTIIDVEQGSERWLEERRGKITGTRLADMWTARAFTKDDVVAKLIELGIEFKKSANKGILEALLPAEARIELELGAEKKLGYYKTLAERLGVDPDDEDRMERGLRLEDEAADEFAKKTGKELSVIGICVSPYDDRIINSPDRLIMNLDTGLYEEAVEIKCLSPAHHLQAVDLNRVPDEYQSQVVQYFIVNPDLKTLYFEFYDPRIKSIPYFVVEVTRESLGDKPEKYLQFQLNQLREMDEFIDRWAF